MGNITMEATVPGIATNRTEEAGSFMATTMARIYANTTDWWLSYSMVSVGEITGPISPINPISSGSQWSWLLLNVTGDWTTVLTDLNTGMVGPFDWTQSPDGIWSSLKTIDNTIDLGISATVCFTGLESNNLWIRADSEREATESRDIPWNKENWKYDTEFIRKMLSTTIGSLSLSNRGLLRLRQPADWTNTVIPDQQFIMDSIMSSMQRLEHPDVKRYYPNYTNMDVFPQTAILTPYSRYNSVNRVLAAIFQDIIKTTGNPALAFQAMFTTMSQMVYYQALPQFSLMDVASITTSETFTMPVRWGGYVIVMALLVIHAALVITAVILFLSKTDHSLLGNAWQAVAQVSSSDTIDTIHHASNMTDLEVKRLLWMNSFEDNEVILRTGTDNGRSQAVYRRGIRESF